MNDHYPTTAAELRERIREWQRERASERAAALDEADAIIAACERFMHAMAAREEESA